MAYPSVTIRPIRPEDEPFLRQLYVDTRMHELASLGWDQSQLDAILDMQFRLQQADYLQRFSAAAFELILFDNEPIGRRYVSREEGEIRIIDIALLTSDQGQGIGSALLQEILAEAATVNKPVRLHVQRENRARHLYARLGFQVIEATDVHLLMQWSPNSYRDDGDPSASSKMK